MLLLCAQRNSLCAWTPTLFFGCAGPERAGAQSVRILQRPQVFVCARQPTKAKCKIYNQLEHNFKPNYQLTTPYSSPRISRKEIKRNRKK